MLDGETAFKLYDTYGFPLDLTQDALRAREIGVDISGFTMRWSARRRKPARIGPAPATRPPKRSGSSSRKSSAPPSFSVTTRKLPRASFRPSSRMVRPVESAADGETVQVVVNQTPFYGESGGHMGDTGVITGDNGAFAVSDTQKRGEGLFVHMGTVSKGGLKVGDAVR